MVRLTVLQNISKKKNFNNDIRSTLEMITCIVLKCSEEKFTISEGRVTKMQMKREIRVSR